MTTIFQCDHLQPVVYIDGGWHHISPSGTVETSVACEAGVYVHHVDLPPHTTSQLVGNYVSQPIP